ncbi:MULTISPECIES: Ig-like domain-containing protein [Paenibacillus]|uniref:Fibronectin type-III domain-containing protein n=1 Tax=Paenibacillus vini TaxID=1476024 RepID=A0ABQ4M915_9BACL|nr:MULTISPECIES: Ig-like domain-containing protein [Paenibacillus]MBQ4900971.1 fibronectin type III domain-containing protein [Paenibacillus sp. Marseille-P2973]GIP52447.1 hypothetical protein J42TS3_14820 [Paenibacillus vini]
MPIRQQKKALLNQVVGSLIFKGLTASLFLCFSFILVAQIPYAHAESMLTIDSPAEGDQVPPGWLRVTGGYTETYDIKLIINGTEQLNSVREDLNGPESGTWYADVDVSKYDGNISLIAKGVQSSSRYGISTATTSVYVNNPEASLPVVKITNPSDDETVHGSVPVKITVDAKNSVELVEIRINGGPWMKAKQTGNHYQFKWDAKNLGNRTSSLEARAFDEFGNEGRSTTVYAHTGNWAPEPVTLEKQDRAMWIWEKAAYNLFLNPGSKSALKALADDTGTFGSDPITTFYIGVFPYEGVDILEDQPEAVREFVKWAHDNGYRVHACIAGGTVPPYYGALAPYHGNAIHEMEKVINYNLSSSADEQFDGVNVDIEPYILPEFKTDKPAVQLQYLDVLQKMIQRRDAAGIDLPFGPAIPRWFDSSDTSSNITWNGQTKWLSEHVQDISDYISIMDYRDTAEGGPGIIPQAQAELAYANAIGKPDSVIVGVETLDIANSGDPETITFREEGRTYMESELDKVYTAFSGDPAFGGIAMHHYDSIRWLPSAWGPSGFKWTMNPPDTAPPTGVSREPQATAFDFSTIELSYGRASDDSDIEEYIIYRGTEPGFTPDDSNIGGTSRNLTYRDTGLLPNSVYYYKVAAVDISGNIGPVSSEVSAVTGNTTLRPMIIGDMNIVFNGTQGKVTLQVIDLETGEGITADVHGRFTYNGGKYVDLITNAAGSATATSETLPKAAGLVGFWPQRIAAQGYYWASAYDRPHTVTVSWPENE